MTEADYPYAARDQSCRHNRSKVIGYIKEHGVSGKNNVQQMKERIQMQPGAIGLNASDPRFEFYSSGTLKEVDSTMINHAVVVVGYHDGTGSQAVKNCKVNRWWVSCTEGTEEGTAGPDA